MRQILFFWIHIDVDWDFEIQMLNLIYLVYTPPALLWQAAFEVSK